MRVAAISDIHGNLPALEAVLAEVEREGVDAIVCCGDVVAGGFPAEVFDRLASLRDVRFVHGNVDRLVVEGTAEHEQDWSAERRRLGDARVAAIASWPRSLELEVGGLGRVLVCHATPSSDEPVYTPLTPDEELERLLGPVGADVLLCGHIHIQYERVLSNGLRIVNPGSVGLPYEGRRGAFWAVLGREVEFRHTEYDVEAAVDAMRALEQPVEERLLEYLLSPMAPETAAAEFERLRGT